MSCRGQSNCPACLPRSVLFAGKLELTVRDSQFRCEARQPAAESLRAYRAFLCRSLDSPGKSPPTIGGSRDCSSKTAKYGIAVVGASRQHTHGSCHQKKRNPHWRIPPSYGVCPPVVHCGPRTLPAACREGSLALRFLPGSPTHTRPLPCNNRRNRCIGNGGHPHTKEAVKHRCSFCLLGPWQ